MYPAFNNQFSLLITSSIIRAYGYFRNPSLHALAPFETVESETVDKVDTQIDADGSGQRSRELVPFTYPFPDFAALMDLPYIIRSSAVRPILQTLAPRPALPSPNISLAFLCFFGLSRFLPSINFSSAWCLLYARNNLIFAF